jgi:hypothetical protein
MFVFEVLIKITASFLRRLKKKAMDDAYKGEMEEGDFGKSKRLPHKDHRVDSNYKKNSDGKFRKRKHRK